MNDEFNEPLQSVTLSREELLAVLTALRADAIAGLDAEPSGELTPELAEFAMVVARRGLLARGLAQVREDGELLLQRGLLKAVGVCAYGDGSVVAHTWPAGAAEPLRLFGHTLAGDAVAHTRPDPVIHRFTRLDSPAALARYALDFCGFDADAPAIPADFTLPQADFVAARELADAGDVAGSQAALVKCGASEPAAAALASAWAAGPRLSVAQTVTPQGDGTARVREFTLTQRDRAGWWAASAQPDRPDAPVRVKATSRAEMDALLGAR